jgi:hypothetical protein
MMLAASASVVLGSVLGVLFILATIYVAGITIRGEPCVCPHCDRTVSRRASVCHHCHRDLAPQRDS